MGQTSSYLSNVENYTEKIIYYSAAPLGSSQFVRGYVIPGISSVDRGSNADNFSVKIYSDESYTQVSKCFNVGNGSVSVLSDPSGNLFLYDPLSKGYYTELACGLFSSSPPSSSFYSYLSIILLALIGLIYIKRGLG